MKLLALFVFAASASEQYLHTANRVVLITNPAAGATRVAQIIAAGDGDKVHDLLKKFDPVQEEAVE